MLLADLGARVVKVEPVDGDLSRRFGPFQNGESLFFMVVNRGKESLAIDPDDWVSKRVLDNLVRKADVVVNNLRQGAMDRLGLGDERCRELNPTLVYASINAFGATGPYARRAGVDVIFQGESGMISITGEPKDGPRKTATTIADYMAGTNAALAISAALAETPRRWRRIDISLRDGLMAVQSGWNALALAGGTQPDRTGTASPFLTPNQVFMASDAPFTLAIVSDRHFELLADALERPDLVEDYPTNALRTASRQTLVRKLARVFATKEAEHWISLLGQAGLPAGRILNLLQALDDPQARHHGMRLGFDHPVAGPVTTTGSPMRVDDQPAVSTSTPPMLGEHTKPILRELGVDAETVAKMVAEGRAVAP
jgi:crotonobetainyl-CoA:carnitine CoA-transferase CaiB-like acyl-CoA transferase